MNIADTSAVHHRSLAMVVAYVSSLSPDQMFTDFGILKSDMELLRRPRLWLTAEDRRIAKSTLETVSLGGLDVVGIGGIELPAEYIGEWLVATVNPCNWMIACAGLGPRRLAADIVAAEVKKTSTGYEPVSPAGMFAMICEIVKYQPKDYDLVCNLIADGVRKMRPTGKKENSDA